MNFPDAVKTVYFKKYATFKGRASRSEYWWSYLLYFLVLFTLTLFDGLNEDPTTIDLGSSIIIFASLIPNIAVGARRLHDINRSGWWVLISLIPIVGFLFLLYWYVQPSDLEINRFGAPPSS